MAIRLECWRFLIFDSALYSDRKTPGPVLSRQTPTFRRLSPYYHLTGSSELLFTDWARPYSQLLGVRFRFETLRAR